MMGHSVARWMADVLRVRARSRRYISARVVEDGEEVVLAERRSTTFSCMTGRSVRKLSSIVARMRVAVRRRLSCVFRSASSLADVAPTPNTIPAVVGGTSLESNSGIRSLSLKVHCLRRGSQSLSTRDTELPKNLASLNASLISFLKVFCVFGNLPSW